MRIPISIVGGGIGGLSLARELSLRGLPTTVLERSSRLNPVGAGIIMNPNAMAVLERNGLAEAVRRDSWPYLTRETRDRHGVLLAIRDYRPLYDAGKLAPGALVHRAHLLDVLYSSLPEGTVRFGVEVQADEVPENSVVVGADGIHSEVRRGLFGDVAPRYMGYRSHRLVVDNVAGVRCFTEYLGRGVRIGLVPISATKLYVWTTFNSPREASLPDPASVFEQFAAPEVRRVRAALPSADEIIVTEIEELTLEGWTRGRAVLLGDAVHAMTPNIGQGAGMAMEDAAVLAEELAGPAEIEQALANYVRRRKARVETVMRISREVGEDGQRSGALACWLRNRRVRREGLDVAKAQSDLERLLAFSG